MKNTKILFSKLALFAATLIWGSSFYIMKNTVDDIPSATLLTVRFLIGFVLLSLVFIKKYKNINFRYILSGFLCGTALFSAYYTQTLGLTDPMNTPGKNAFLTAVYCVIVPFLYWIFEKKKPSAYNIVSAIMCICGIWCISYVGTGVICRGDALTLLGGLCYAFHILVVKKTTADKDVILVTILQFGFSALWSAVIAFFTEDYNIIVNIGRTEMLSLLYLGVFCTTVALLFQNIGQKYTSPNQASIILSLESVFGVLFSIVFYEGEVVTPKMIIGFVLVFTAVIISEAAHPETGLKKKSKKKKQVKKRNK